VWWRGKEKDAGGDALKNSFFCPYLCPLLLLISEEKFE